MSNVVKCILYGDYDTLCILCVSPGNFIIVKYLQLF